MSHYFIASVGLLAMLLWVTPINEALAHDPWCACCYEILPEGGSAYERDCNLQCVPPLYEIDCYATAGGTAKCAPDDVSYAGCAEVPGDCWTAAAGGCDTIDSIMLNNNCSYLCVGSGWWGCIPINGQPDCPAEQFQRFLPCPSQCCECAH